MTWPIEKFYVLNFDGLKFWKVDYGYFNPFSLSVSFLYPLEALENLWFSDVFRGYKNVIVDLSMLM